ncbi:hypothetical protein HNV10_15145 [Winogradskyella litoriviva]|uniref:Transglutaminase-like domain-containing protein n=1 Tax=Winogradskyella litoriviva TaxID=1220182 RepID=A0ABX2EA43_9FLAO|nr:transglutaminase domain-containing protein [Winogradskyella litoriviva]NRD24589.1 hypothetical protein [Winogradskyella litoriviva]
MKNVLLLLFLCFAHLCNAQDYHKVDSIVKLYPSKFKSIESFAKKIDSDFKTEIEKTRAAYYWIANHISYDYEMFQKNESAYKGIKYDNQSEYEEKQLKQEIKYAEQCLKKKKAVCEGYSQLLKFTLNELGITCEVISGSSKQSYREIGRIRNSSNHAWNAVKIENQWQLIDATWSTGNLLNSPNTFNFNDTYFFTNPEVFILSHFPEKEKWQLIDKPMDRSTFFHLPIIYHTFIDSEIKLSKKTNGLLKVKEKGTIQLKFNDINEDKFYSYAFKGQKTTRFLFEKIGNEFIVNIPYLNKRPTSLILYYEGKSILKYKIVLEK